MEMFLGCGAIMITFSRKNNIVNNYLLTKNKTIYHVRISKQGNGEGLPSVINRFIFGHWVVIMPPTLKK